MSVDPKFRAVSGTRYGYASGGVVRGPVLHADGMPCDLTVPVEDIGGSWNSAPDGWADHVRHIEADNIHRDPSGCIVCNKISTRRCGHGGECD
jgi:hypothetical protein